MVSESQTTGVTLPWEKKAMVGEEMPDGLSYPDQLLYQAMALLYARYRLGSISREQAVVEKKKLLEEYRVYQFQEDMGKEWVERIRLTDMARAEYRKNPTIKNADKLIAILEGRVKI